MSHHPMSLPFGLASIALVAAAAQAQCTADWAMHLPPPRTDSSAAFDADRQRVVLFGGTESSNLRADTWEYDGAAWRLAATTGPAARRGHKLIYDPLRRRTLLIGGYTGSSGPIETWAWDGATWRLLDDVGPSFTLSVQAGLETGAAFDASRGRAVLFLSNGETWEFDAAAGWQRIATTGPAPRRGMAMAYDPVRRRVVLFGGVIGTTRQSDTWEWDGTEWRSLPIAGPTARSEARMDWDPGAQRLILFGGAGSGGTRVRDTWALSGQTWTQILPAAPTSPATGSGNAMVFDAARQRAILFGGSVAPWMDIFTLDPGGEWAQVQFGPSARTGAAVAYDETRREAVLFGGLAGSRQGDTWTFDGAQWRMVAATGPSARNEHAMAYDPIRNRVILFGGNTGSLNAETWSWDGSAWTRLFPANSPSARERHSMAFEPNLGGIVLHGGSTGASNAQTWFWDGSDWSLIATGPTRAGHAMGYSPILGRLVLYGGSGAGVNQRAWAFDPVALSWSQIGMANGPATATEHTLSFDPDSGQMLLIGATSGDAAVWLFDGDNWRRIANTPNTSRARNNHVAWRDPFRGRTIAYGGTTASTANRETWEFRGVGGPALEGSPTWTVSCPDGMAAFTVNLIPGADAPESVVWLKDGVPIGAGATPWGSVRAITSSPDGLEHTLTITGVRDADTGGYQAILTGDCGGATVTNPAGLRICDADFNCSGSGVGDGVSEQDIFDFLAAWFAVEPRADINRDQRVSVEDIFAFLVSFFAGC